jgi:hypothetical protein
MVEVYKTGAKMTDYMEMVEQHRRQSEAQRSRMLNASFWFFMTDCALAIVAYLIVASLAGVWL